MTEVMTTQKQSPSTYYPEGKRLYPRLDCGMQEGFNVPKIAVDVSTEPPTIYEFSVAENKYVPSETLVLSDNGDVVPQNSADSSGGNGGSSDSSGGSATQNPSNGNNAVGETRPSLAAGGKVVNLGQDNFYIG